MYTIEEVPNMIPAIIDKLKNLPDGAWTTTAWLVKAAGFEVEGNRTLLMEIHRVLFEAAEAEHIFLDMSCHEGKYEGLPYDLRFQVFHGNPKAETDEVIPSVLPGDDECDLEELGEYIADEDWASVTDWAINHERSADPVIIEKITECYRLASDNGYIPATVCLANLYYVGRFVEQDYKEAFRLNKIAADAGDRNGLTNCGYCCYYGRHKSPDYAEACMYYSLGAMLYNDANCLYKLGDLFRYGYGVEKNEVYAYMLYQRAFDRCGESEPDFGSTPDCAMRLGECELKGIGTEVDVNEAHVKLNFALMNFYRIRRDDPFVAGLIKKTKALIAEAEAILDREISGMGVDL